MRQLITYARILVNDAVSRIETELELEILLIQS